MEISMAAQGIVFLFSCGVGAFLGVLYDVFRIIRIAFNSKWVSVFFQDFIFCIFSALSVILLVYYTNSGVVRWFSLFGCFLCFVLYHMTIGRLVIFVSRKIIDFIKKTIEFLISITFVPLKIAVLFTIKQLKRLNTAVFRLCMRTERSLYYKREKRSISRSASYGFGLYTVSAKSRNIMKYIFKKNKKTPKYILDTSDTSESNKTYKIKQAKNKTEKMNKMKQNRYKKFKI